MAVAMAVEARREGGESTALAMRQDIGPWRVGDEGLVAGPGSARAVCSGTLGSLIDREDLLAVARALPPLPPVQQRLTKILALPDDAIDLAALVDCFRHDPALAVAVVRESNERRFALAQSGLDPQTVSAVDPVGAGAAASGKSGLGGAPPAQFGVLDQAAVGVHQAVSVDPVRDVDEALAYIGRERAIEIARRVVASARTASANGDVYGATGNDLWRHSVMSALAAELIVDTANAGDPAEAVLAALIHDIGKLLLCRYLTPNIVQLLKLAAENDGFSEVEAELEVLQAHHGEVGALVLGTWRFSLSTLLAVQHHHNPEIGFDPACTIVALADVVAHDLAAGAALGSGVGVGSPVCDGGLDDDNQRSGQRAQLLGELAIDPEAYGIVIRTTAARFAHLARRFDLA
ncbi:MAG: HDOD domain-containing protein [Acidimicrobiales bacterium]|nr:HDOD domain-containing protein [Acidimicrobiales bacterium]